MEVLALNHVDLAAVPESVKVDLCMGAIEMVQRRREEPGYRERFEKWLAEQGRKPA